MANPVLVIMAAGMGSRYGGLKQIDPIGPNGQILLDYSIYDAHRAGFDRVVFIIRPELHEAFEDAIGKKARRFMQVDYAYQTLDNLPDGLTAPEGREKPLGTAHAVWCAKELTAGCPIAVINADDFYGADAFRKMYDYLASAQDDDKFRYCMVGYQVENTLTENGTVSRGVCTADENGLLAHIIERTAIHRDDQTIPLILCAEEDVEGNHGASIGSLDDELIFYLESRGISEEAAYELMAKARLKAVCKKIPVEGLRAELNELLDGEEPVGEEQ